MDQCYSFDKSSLKRLCGSLRVVQVMSPEMTLNAFLISALEEGMVTLANEASFSQSSSSRDISLLSAHHHVARRGVNLLILTPPITYKPPKWTLMKESFL